MSRCSNRLIFLILILTTISLNWGCSQPEDVLSDISSTRLTLDPERLPTLPSGMVYELWITDVNSTDISLGKFSYDHVNRVYLEPGTSTERSNEFWLEDDLLKQYWHEDSDELRYWFTTVFVSIETFPDGNNAEHGPIMLHDAITNPINNPIEMSFHNKETVDPLSNATISFNMQTVSDSNRLESSIGQGLWYSNYQRINQPLYDTIEIYAHLEAETIDPEFADSLDENGNTLYLIDTSRCIDNGFVYFEVESISGTDTTFVIDTIIGNDTTFVIDSLSADCDTVYLYDRYGNIFPLPTDFILNSEEIFFGLGPVAISGGIIDTTLISFEADSVYLGSDTLKRQQYQVQYDYDSNILGNTPYMRYTPVYDSYLIDTSMVELNIFSQNYDGLPNYSGDDWQYQGWIVSNTAQKVDVNNIPRGLLSDDIDARFTPPAWEYNTPTNQLLPGDDGVLISTGTFSMSNAPDDGNPFVLDSLLVPPYPGEDFVNTTELNSVYSINEKFDFLPSTMTNFGATFITLEPTNFTGNSTNFPLIVFGKKLPASKAEANFTNTTLAGQFDMWNWTQTIKTDQIGFPIITIEVERF